MSSENSFIVEDETTRHEIVDISTAGKSHSMDSFDNRSDVHKKLHNRIAVKNLNAQIDFLRFSSESSKLSSEYNLSLTSKNNLIQNLLSSVENAKSKALRSEFFLSDSQTTFKALNWFKNKLLQQLSKNRSKRKEIAALQCNIKDYLLDKQKLESEITNKKGETEVLKAKLDEESKKLQQSKTEIDTLKSKLTLENKKLIEIELQHKNKLKLIESENSKKLEKSQKKIKKASTEFTQIIRKMEQKINELKEQKSEQLKIISDKNSACQQSEKKIESLNKELREAESKFAQSKKRKHEMKAKIEKLLDEKRDTLQELNKKDSELKTEIKLHSMTKNETHKQEKKLQTLYNKTEELQKELSNEQTKYRQILSELSETKRILSDSMEKRSDTNSQRDKELNRLKIENLKLVQEKDETNKKMQKIEKDNAEIKNFYLLKRRKSEDKQTQSNKSNAISTNSRGFSLEQFLKEELEISSQRSQEFEKENFRLSQKLLQYENKENEEKVRNERTVKSLEQKISRLNNELQLSKTKITGLEKINQGEKSARDEFDKLMRENLDLKNTNFKIESELVKIKNQWREFSKKQMKTAENVNGNTNDEKQKLVKLEQELKLAESRLHEKSQQVKLLNKKIEEYRKMEEMFDKVKEENKKLKTEQITITKTPERKNLRSNNLFEILNSSKKARNIVDEELLKLKESLNSNIYSKIDAERENESILRQKRIASKRLSVIPEEDSLVISYSSFKHTSDSLRENKLTTEKDRNAANNITPDDKEVDNDANSLKTANVQVKKTKVDKKAELLKGKEHKSLKTKVANKKPYKAQRGKKKTKLFYGEKKKRKKEKNRCTGGY